ncbi:MAG TPA: prepilin-type N-terminal cleavage/methylation domain-containing protein [Phycisphaerales bacterium]|nr:prepilin-type N-terminal cleavage/methylation domain-containing protein [Phycisphaerales bacterium]
MTRTLTTNPFSAPACPQRRGFTIVELLIVVAIIAVLISLILPAASGTLKSARGFRCQLAQRSIAFDFAVFADEQLHGDRGDDEVLGDRHFRLETFLDSQYMVDEFWAWPGQTVVRIPDTRGNDPMRCAEVSGDLTLRSNMPCSMGAVEPPQRVSFGFNIRLHRPEITGPSGPQFSPPVRLTSAVIDADRVPLFWDVDGQAAFDRGVSPMFGGPSLGSTGPLGGDLYWFPAARHQNQLNVAFTDGSVEATSDPLSEAGWRWDYQPVR